MAQPITKIVPIKGGLFAYRYVGWRVRSANASERYEAEIRSSVAKPVVEYQSVEVIKL